MTETETTTVRTARLLGVEGREVHVTAHLTSAHRGIRFDGNAYQTPQGREALLRVRSALANSGRVADVDACGVLVGLSDGGFAPEMDLAVAVAVAQVLGALPESASDGWGFVGELALDGSLRPTRGALPLAAALASGRVVAPSCHLPELTLAGGAGAAFGAGTLAQVLDALSGHGLALPRAVLGGEPTPPRRVGAGRDLADVKGCGQAKRALLVAAAGGHGLLLVGPPGTSKTMLARCLPGLLPPLSPAERREVAGIWSAAGLLQGEVPTAAPFRAPHHTVSFAGLLGGGPALRPGEVTLAHAGALLLDELPEFSANTLGGLANALREGAMEVVRQGDRVAFPARPLVVATMNPCPCGWAGSRERSCGCSPERVVRYRARADVLPCFDIQGDTTKSYHPAAWATLTTADARAMVDRARLAQAGRGYLNARATARELRDACRLDAGGHRALGRAVRASEDIDSTRVQRALRVARTLADLDDDAGALAYHVEEALALSAI